MTKYQKNKRQLLSFGLIGLPTMFAMKGEWDRALLALILLGVFLHFWDFYIKRRKICFWYLWAVCSFVSFTFALGLMMQVYPNSWGILTWLWALSYAAIEIVDCGVMENYYNVSGE